MVYKVDGNPQLDSRDWNMYSNILKVHIVLGAESPFKLLGFFAELEILCPQQPYSLVIKSDKMFSSGTGCFKIFLDWTKVAEEELAINLFFVSLNLLTITDNYDR